MDIYFRNPDTVLAKTLRRVSPKEGDEYRNRKNVAKRVVDVAVAAPLWAITRPAEIGIRAAVRITERKNAIYRSDRVGKSIADTIEIRKIRSMYSGSDSPENHGDLGRRHTNGKMHDDSSDPRVTKIGKIIRPLKLDELPQLWDILTGKLSIIGIRAVSVPVWNRIVDELPKERSEKWQKKYAVGRPGGGHLFDIMRSQHSEIIRRYNSDMFYADHASLGLELYLLYRYAQKLSRRLKPGKQN